MSDDALKLNAKYYSFNGLVYYHHLRSSLNRKKIAFVYASIATF